MFVSEIGVEFYLSCKIVENLREKNGRVCSYCSKTKGIRKVKDIHLLFCISSYKFNGRFFLFMNELVNKDSITTLELLKQINIFREQEGNRAELKHKTLLEVVRDEFEEEIGEQKILPTSYKDKWNREQPMYILTLNQAKQILVRESKFVRKAVIHYIEELENKLKQITQPKLPQTYLEALKELVKVEEQKLQLENQVNRLVHSKKLYTTTEIAKELGIKSAAEFNKMLAKDKIQYNVNNTWVLTSKYADKDYVSIKQTELDNGKIIYDRKWTGLGRDFLLNKYKEVV